MIVLECAIFVHRQIRPRWCLLADPEGELLQVVINFPEEVEK